jgi:HEPN domain-containing protein
MMKEPPLTRRDFQRLADLRAKEAGLLAENRNEAGAFYLGGYAVECALKACIAKKTKRHEFPPKVEDVRKVYTHNLEELLKLAGLDKQLEIDAKTNPNLGINWGVVKDWNEEKRYKASGLNGRDLHAAVSGPSGVLLWIKQRW